MNSLNTREPATLDQTNVDSQHLSPVSASPLSHQAEAARSSTRLKQTFQWLPSCRFAIGLVSCDPAQTDRDPECDWLKQRSSLLISQGALGCGCWGFWEMSPLVVFLVTAVTDQRKDE